MSAGVFVSYTPDGRGYRFEITVPARGMTVQGWSEGFLEAVCDVDSLLKGPAFMEQVNGADITLTGHCSACLREMRNCACYGTDLFR